MTAFPVPQPGASLLLAFRPVKKIVLVIGGNQLAASRHSPLLKLKLLLPLLRKAAGRCCEELRWRAEQGQLSLVDLDTLPCSITGPADHTRDGKAIDTFVYTLPDRVELVCITDTVTSPASGFRRDWDSAEHIVRLCQHRGIPTNVADMPDLCSFTFMASHRFPAADSKSASPLQRDIIASLPKEIGSAVENTGKLRALAKSSDADVRDLSDDQELSEDSAPGTPNEPIEQRTTYWPISRLARLTDDGMGAVLDGEDGLRSLSAPGRISPEDALVTPVHQLTLTPPRQGRIFLVGSGPGHPSLLTVATHAALTRHAQLVLSDKLVPAAVLDLIPSGVEVRIARKFPGNADGAQTELMEAAVEAARRGLTVVRLKQGDPTVYGRVGEEILYFRAHGIEPVVVPGVSSALAGPIFAGIPVTQRGAAESFVVCTGVGRAGRSVSLPGYARSRTLVVLMGVARLPQLLHALLAENGARDGAPYPAHTPVALIERASMPDQRVVSSTLRDIAAGLESIGEQRPPGMLVIGWSVPSLWAEGNVTVLEEGAEAHDEERVSVWLEGKRWRVAEGLEMHWGEW
ncbi:uroporphyrin-III C-methyltransferase [Epithele typhae]|uniref:uroporphyrin-III C-methyltransferase n=1 Tax=Epithele typhae TaxID=378194 RepID=UPI002007DF43|nr:uroporphyrin-III C-methyltransferase [Epithele typhae]KAH9932104.1 uroporphyrin-III C-methyltransferase [Epithele typhae]